MLYSFLGLLLCRPAIYPRCNGSSIKTCDLSSLSQTTKFSAFICLHCVFYTTLPFLTLSYRSLLPKHCCGNGRAGLVVERVKFFMCNLCGGAYMWLERCTVTLPKVG